MNKLCGMLPFILHFFFKLYFILYVYISDFIDLYYNMEIQRFAFRQCPIFQCSKYNNVQNIMIESFLCVILDFYIAIVTQVCNSLPGLKL